MKKLLFWITVLAGLAAVSAAALQKRGRGSSLTGVRGSAAGMVSRPGGNPRGAFGFSVLLPVTLLEGVRRAGTKLCQAGCLLLMNLPRGKGNS